MDIFMIVIFAILSFFGGCLCRIQTKTYLNSGSIFCFIWGITGIFSNMGLYGVYLPSGIVNIAMLLGIAVFAIVYSALHNTFFYSCISYYKNRRLYVFKIYSWN